MRQRFIAWLAVFILLVSSFSPVTALAATNEIHYVALGDSLAAGQTPYRELDKGFSGIIAEQLEANGTLGSYTNQFAVSGYTSKQVLDDIVNNKEVNGQHIQDQLKQANLVTLTVGANDLLQAADIDLQKGTIALDPETVAKVTQNIYLNLTQTFAQIQSISEATIYVSGYYNPFPYLDEEQQELVTQAMAALNGAIKLAAIENGTTYVSLDGAFDDQVSTYLPNPYDIHPSLEGYQQMANAFLNVFPMINPTPIYTDVADNNWAAKEIELLIQTGVMEGISDTQFGPYVSITRAQTAKALLNVIILDTAMPENPGFSDVDETHEAYYAIAKLTQAGIFQKGEKFNPDAPLTRAQMAKVLTMVLNLDASQSSTFKDVSANHWAKPYVDALVSANITTGYSDHTFRPNQETTRAQFAAFLVRSMQTKKIDLALN